MKIINLKHIMKKFIAMMLGVAVFFTAIPAFVLQAETTTSPELTVSSSTVTAGNSVSIYVNAQNWENIAGLNFAIYYDSSALKVSNTYNGSLMGSTVTDVNKNTEGVVTTSFLSVDGISGSGQVMRIVFTSLSTAKVGDYYLELVVSEAYNTNFEDVTISKTSGKITINEKTVTEGTATFLAVPSKTALETSEEFTYQIKSSSIGKLAGGDYEIRYDAEYLEVVDVALGTPFKATTAVTSIKKDVAGYIKVSHADIKAISASYGTVLFTVTFKTKDLTVNNTSIEFSTAGLTDEELNSMSSSAIIKSISIKEREQEVIYPAFKMMWDGITHEDRTVQVDVVLPGEAMVSAGDFVITYDNKKIVCVKAETDSSLSAAGGLLITKEDMGNGTVSFSYVNSNPTDEDTSILHLTFEIVDGFFGNVSLQASGKDIVNSSFEDITLSYPSYSMSLTSIIGLAVSGLSDRYTYTGKEIMPEVAIDNLVKGQDYTVAYSNNLNVGIATVLISGMGSYTETIVKTFEIVQANLSDISDELIHGIEKEYVYTGNEIEPQVSIGDFIVNQDFDVEYENHVNVGIATVKVTGKDNCTGIIEVTFEIKPATNTGMKVEVVQAEGTEFVYTGTEICPAVRVEGYVEGVDYEVSYKNNVNAGTATVMVTGKGNYTGTVEATFEIKPAANTGMQVEVVQVEGTEFVYTGTEICPTVRVEGYTEGVDYEVSYKNNVNAGTATVMVTGKGNYAGTVEKTFEIIPTTTNGMTVEIVPSLEGKFVYTGEEIKPEVTVKGFTEGLDYEVSYKDNVNVGTAIVVVTGKGNYAGTVEKTFEITPTSMSGMTVEIVPAPEGKFVYTGEEIKPEVTVEGYTEGVDYEVSYKNNVNAGTATVVVTGKGNYAGTVEKTFEITPISMSGMTVVIVPAPEGKFVYTGEEIRPEVTVKGFTEGVDYEVSYKNNVNAGTATVMVTGKGNYVGTIESTFTILPIDIAEMAVEIVPVEGGFIYTGEGIKPQINVGKLIEGIDYEVIYTNNVNAGVATITINAAGNNCSGTVTETFTIEKAQQKVTGSDLWYTSIQETSFPLDIVSVQGDGILSYRSENPEIVEVDENGMIIIHHPGTATITVIKAETDNYVALYKTVTIEVDSVYKLPLSWDGYVLDIVVPGEVLISSAIINILTEFDKLAPLDLQIDGNALDKISIEGIEAGEGISILYKNSNPKETDTFVIHLYLAKVLQVDTTSVLVQTSDVSSKYDNFRLEYETLEIALNDITGCSYWVEDLEEKYTYTGNEIRPNFQFFNTPIENFINAELISVEYVNNIDVGTATIIVTGHDGLTGSFAVTFNILPKDMSALSSTLISGIETSYVYTGSEIRPQVKVDGLVKYIDYEVDYANNLNAGTATVTLRGRGNYTGTITKTFLITKAQQELSATDFWEKTTQDDGFSLDATVIKGNGNISYRSENPEIVTVNENGLVTINSAGTATITVFMSETDNYEALQKPITVEVNTPYTIQIVRNGDTIDVIIPGEALISSCVFSLVATGQKVLIVPMDVITNATDKISLDLSEDSTNEMLKIIYTNSNPQADDTFILRYVSRWWPQEDTETVSVVVSDVVSQQANIVVSGETIDFSLKDVSALKHYVRMGQTEYEYTGHAITPDWDMGWNSISSLIQNGYMKIEYSDNIKAGTASMIFKGINGWTGESIVNYEITPIPMDRVSWDIDEYCYEYTGSAIEPKVYSYDNLTEGVDYVVTYRDNINVGTATVIITGIRSVVGTYEMTFEIDAVWIDDVIYDKMQEIESSYEYTGEEIKPLILIEGCTEGIDYEVSYQHNVEIGTATITIVGIGNYIGTTTLNFEITEIHGDFNKDKMLTTDDAIYLLNYVMKPYDYPIRQSDDMDGNGVVNSDDAIYLLYHIMLGEKYPLHK